MNTVVVFFCIYRVKNKGIRYNKRNDNAKKIHNKELIMQLDVIQKFNQVLTYQDSLLSLIKYLYYNRKGLPPHLRSGSSPTCSVVKISDQNTVIS